MAFGDYYRNTVTAPSYVELLRFGGWLNQVYGYHPIVVGGWAVFLYARSLGSKDIDIDIILPTRQNVERIMVQWYNLSGYASVGELERSYFKEVPTPEGPIRVEMDVASFADRNAFLENTSLELPWSLCESHSRTHREGSVDLRIPEAELLLAYKTKAVRDRRHRLQTSVLSSLRREALASKIWKDEHDIRELEKVVLDSNRCLELIDSPPVAQLIREEWRRLNLFR